MRSEGSRGAKVCKHSGPRGLDKARLRHRSDRAAMDTAENAESAHSPALPPPRNLCPPPAPPGSEGFWRPWLRTPEEKEKREEPRAADTTVLAQVQVLRLLISRSRDSPEKLPNSSYNFIL
ncbi:protein ripply2 isoform X3 [Arvicola amphibius]|uniref:protein ripply2 isoform X3 n=1 Tax=Arvicola amphibius TaxID=1047088 RepID=UPI0018E2A3BF|nr:protein ripply2 isoform X3 [Arvicola amphibius]